MMGRVMTTFLLMLIAVGVTLTLPEPLSPVLKRLVRSQCINATTLQHYSCQCDLNGSYNAIADVSSFCLPPSYQELCYQFFPDTTASSPCGCCVILDDTLC
ncbi:hypothetical protein Hamer_G015146 [Homarus americanus]|uniref:Uncharacterized protein n=1 Tax=Homarus americanus TaxID=6706 RepID=A0A8J5TG90_HOMAM|nr:hypothetical protein Hamer_G015146 [Homarus americanus]